MLRLPHFRWKPERVTMSSFRESEFFLQKGTPDHTRHGFFANKKL